jgi:hypothetical protein
MLESKGNPGLERCGISIHHREQGEQQAWTNWMSSAMSAISTSCYYSITCRPGPAFVFSPQPRYHRDVVRLVSAQVGGVPGWVCSPQFVANVPVGERPTLFLGKGKCTSFGTSSLER